MNKLNKWVLALFAKFVARTKDSKWWLDHLKHEQNVKWDGILSEAIRTLDIEQESRRESFIAILKNTCDNLRTSAAAVGSSNLVASDSYNRIVMRTTAHILNEIQHLSNIVGIQPMQGPVGLVYNLAFRDTDDPSDVNNRKSIRLEVVKSTTEAKTRKLKACYNIEAAQDLNALHGLDMVSEMACAIGSEVANEIFREVISNLIDLAGQSGLTEEVKLPEVEYPFLAGQASAIVFGCNRLASLIAHKTRRGAGNWIIADPLVVTMLQAAPASVFVPAPKDTKQSGSYSTIKFCGTLNSSIRVYTTLDQQLEGKVLIGYKGGSGDIDAGYIYCPYIPLMMSGVVINPETFQPMVSCMTRHGTHVVKPSENSFTDGKNYYAVLDVSKMKPFVVGSTPDAVQSSTTPQQSGE